MPRREATLVGLPAAAAADRDDLAGVHPRASCRCLISQGAGAEMRRTLGTTVFSGMLGVTIFGILLTPVFFVLVDWVGEYTTLPLPRLAAGQLRSSSASSPSATPARSADG